jgi:polyisoprenoid-binding protein YceI
MGTWKIDPAHTDVLFSAKHMMVTTVRGKFDQVEGELELDENEPLASTGEIRIAAGSISTGVEPRDAHLRSADFFDVDNHEWIVARATGVERKGDGYLVHTDVTIRGVTRPVAFEAEFLGVVPNLQGGRHVGFHLRGRVNRRDWGLNWNMALEAGGWLVGDEITLEVDVAADAVAVGEAALAGAAS